MDAKTTKTFITNYCNNPEVETKQNLMLEGDFNGGRRRDIVNKTPNTLQPSVATHHEVFVAASGRLHRIIPSTNPCSVPLDPDSTHGPTPRTRNQLSERQDQRNRHPDDQALKGTSTTCDLKLKQDNPNLISPHKLKQTTKTNKNIVKKEEIQEPTLSRHR